MNSSLRFEFDHLVKQIDAGSEFREWDESDGTRRVQPWGGVYFDLLLSMEMLLENWR